MIQYLLLSRQPFQFHNFTFNIIINIVGNIVSRFLSETKNFHTGLIINLVVHEGIRMTTILERFLKIFATLYSYVSCIISNVLLHGLLVYIQVCNC